MRKRVRATSKNAVLIRRYDLSTEESKRKISDALDELFGLVKELSALARLRGFRARRNRDVLEKRVPEIAAELERAAGAVLWELGLIANNSRSASALLDFDKPKRAMAERVKFGAYRASVLEKHGEAISRYRKILSANPNLEEG